MRNICVLVVAGLMSTGVGMMSPAMAKSASKAACAWQTQFSGEREVGLINTWHQRYSAAPCFASQASCKAWLYKTQTAFPLAMDFTPCHRR